MIARNPAARSRILLLGGTIEARQLATVLSDCDALSVTASLSGATVTPKAYPVLTRVGGFGGIQGLINYLQHNRIDVLINATHPFAATISHSASVASSTLGIPYLRLLRPAWVPVSGDRWSTIASLSDLSPAVGNHQLVPPGAQVLLASGRGSLTVALDIARRRPDVTLYMRLVDPTPARELNNSARPKEQLGRPDNLHELAASPPFSEASELQLMRRLAISHLVTKNAGGTASYAKIVAARRLNMPVLMVSRPVMPATTPRVWSDPTAHRASPHQVADVDCPGTMSVETVDQAADWLRRRTTTKPVRPS